MLKRIVASALCIALVIVSFPSVTFASKNTDDIIILYENDVHCAIEGYSKLSALKDSLLESYAYVGAVSSGDYINGSSLGVVSQGEYIINIQNLVGYDALTLGNHEFGYKLTRLDELVDIMKTKPVCCNFQKIGEEGSYFEPYSIVSYGDTDIAYIGVTTPSTITSSWPLQFKDENGEYLYTFNPTTLYDVVQNNIDKAKAQGADYVIALCHIGYENDESYEDIVDLIENTDGLDVVLDAHSHSVIEQKTVTDKGSNEVLLSSTGTKFEYIGKLTISQGEPKTELIKTEDLTATDPEIDGYISKITEDYAELGERIIAYSEVDLVTQNKDGNRLVRIAETNLGDLCADAFLAVMDADVAYTNGGGLRADILSGDITFNDLLSVFPFNNTVVLAEIDGQSLKDMLEMSVMHWPQEDGSFPHLAGITFSMNTEIPSSVILDENEEFVEVSGQYRVYDIKIFNKETEKYEPLRLDGKYTIASHNYALIEQGSGMSMLKDVKILKNEGLLDIDAVTQYIEENLGGVVGEEYEQMSPNITFTEGELIQESAQGLSKWIIYVIIITVVIIIFVLIFVIFAIKKSKKTDIISGNYEK